MNLDRSISCILFTARCLPAKVRETLELNKLKSAPSQLPPVSQDFNGCKLVIMNLNWSISCILFPAPCLSPRVRETFELNHLKSAPSQLPPVFSGFHRFSQDFTGCKLCCHEFGPVNILYFVHGTLSSSEGSGDS
jgi:hypothetical protein